MLGAQLIVLLYTVGLILLIYNWGSASIYRPLSYSLKFLGFSEIFVAAKSPLLSLSENMETNGAWAHEDFSTKGAITA